MSGASLSVLCLIVAVGLAGCTSNPPTDGGSGTPRPSVSEDPKEPFDWAFWNQASETWWIECALWDKDDALYVNDSFSIAPGKVTLHLVPDAYGPASTYGTCGIGRFEGRKVVANESDIYWDCTGNTTFCWRENYWSKDAKTAYLKDSTRLWLADSTGKLRLDGFSENWVRTEWVRG